MVQDLQIINQAVAPLYPAVPNPYVILGEIPPSAKWLTVLDLKDAFFAYHWLKNPNTSAGALRYRAWAQILIFIRPTHTDIERKGKNTHGPTTQV